MQGSLIRILAENLPEQRFLEAIFRDEARLGVVEISSWLTSSAVVGTAQRSLREHPERPVALVVNSETLDPGEIEDLRATIRRILARSASDGWSLALAIPKVEAWVMADSRIRAAFAADEATRDNRYEQAVRIGELARKQPIDREAIAAAFPDFRELAAFIERHAPVPQPTA